MSIISQGEDKKGFKTYDFELINVIHCTIV